MISYSNLGSLKAHGGGLIAFCESRDCGHYAPIDLDKLISRFGPDFDIVDGDAQIRALLKCAKCGGKRLSVQVKPPTGRLML
jgi:hypothetical protein